MTELSRASSIAATALAIVLFALAPMALAQVPQPTLSVAFEEGTLAIEAANTSTTRTVNGTVTYGDTAPALPGGAADGTITLSVTAPAGWTATLDPASAFTLAPGASAPFTVTLVAPAATANAASVSIDVAGSATSSDGQRSATASASLSIAQAALPPPPPVPWYQTPAGIAGIVLAILVVLGATTAILWQRRTKRLAAERAAAEAAARAAYLERETGITVQLLGEPVQYGHKREVVFRVAVTNTSQRPRVALADVTEVTNGWRAALQFSKLPLSVGETRPVTLVVTPDSVITPGDQATVVVRAKPEEARELSEKVTIPVSAPKHGVPNDPHYRIVSVHREGANIGVKR
ncbi:MAG TPA: NEW3 domain-containing protein [Candidatus Thermoplasmatota archaeon]|nr:NEW3 domain-containing protein [Candidatus Thermoplasmatota archaeon]